MMLFFDIVVAAIHMLAAWAGVATYTVRYETLPPVPFWIWHTILLVFFVTLTTLTYLKFFHRLKLSFFIATQVGTAMLADLLAFQWWRPANLQLSWVHFVASYLLILATVWTCSLLMKKKND